MKIDTAMPSSSIAESSRKLTEEPNAETVEDPEKEIVLYISSPGGSVHDGMAIYDAMRAIEAPVSTVCIGMAMSMGSFLLSAGEPGRRFAWPHARIMIHQPWGGAQGNASDIEIQAAEIQRLKDRLNEILAEHTGQKMKKIVEDSDRDYFMSPDEAKKYGLVDEVVKSRKEVASLKDEKKKK